MKLQALGTETLAKVFSCEFFEIFKNTFYTEHLWTIASKQGYFTGDSQACFNLTLSLANHSQRLYAGAALSLNLELPRHVFESLKVLKVQSFLRKILKIVFLRIHYKLTTV